MDTGFCDVSNSSSEPLIFRFESIGYYKVKQSVIQHHLEPQFEIKPLQVLGKEFNKLTNTLKR